MLNAGKEFSKSVFICSTYVTLRYISRAISLCAVCSIII